MSIGFSLGDFVAVGQLAWSVYKSSKEAPESFTNVSLEVLSLHAIIKEFGDNLALATLPSSQLEGLQTVTRGCRKVLNDLQSTLNRYNSLGSSSKRTWDRLAWGKENITELRARLISNTGLLNAFVSTSQIRVQQRLEKYLDDCQQGRRERTITSEQSLPENDDSIWLEIRRELEDLGVTASAFSANRVFIIQWFKDSVQTGCFDEHNHDCQQPRDVYGAANSEDPVSDKSSSNKLTDFDKLPDDPGFNEPLPDNSFEIDSPRNDQPGDADINDEISTAQRPLLKSSRQKPEIVVNELLNKNSGVAEDIAEGHRWTSVSSKDRRGRTQLHVAARKGRTAFVMQLIQAGAPLEARDIKGTTALHQATYGHRREIVELLLKNGADIEAEEAGPYKRTSLAIAIAEGAESAAIVLLSHGASIKYLYHAERILLHVAARTMSKERTFRLLLKAGANPNARNTTGRTPLHTAVANDNPIATRHLLKVGVDVNVQDAWKETPLHFAAKDKNRELTKMLLIHGADVNVMNNSRKKAKTIIKSKGLGDLLDSG
ncbi:MAG: hypothetical protein Q9220_003030 [cf. Caloplaca sp. 1 TL-2023]